MAFSMRKELRGIMLGGALARLGLKRANKKVVKVPEARATEERRRQGGRGGEREKKGVRACHALPSLSCSPSPSLPPPPPPL